MNEDKEREFYGVFRDMIIDAMMSEKLFNKEGSRFNSFMQDVIFIRKSVAQPQKTYAAREPECGNIWDELHRAEGRQKDYFEEILTGKDEKKIFKNTLDDIAFIKSNSEIVAEIFGKHDLVGLLTGINSRINELPTLNDIADSMEDMRLAQTSTKEIVDKLHTEVKTGVADINILKKILLGDSGMENKLEAIQVELQELKKVIIDANDERKEKEEAKEKLNGKIAELDKVSGEKNSLVEKLGKVEKENGDLKEEIKVKNSVIGQLEQEISDLKGKQDTNDREMDELKGERDKASAGLNEWENFAEDYKPIFNAIKNCPTFQPLLVEKNINKTADLIRAIGESNDFAKAIHEQAKKIKQANKEPITSEEKEVYKTLNSFYRKLWPEIDFDVFAVPGGKSVEEEFVKTRYDTREATNIFNENDSSSANSQEVYVPWQKNRTGKIYYKALVKAGNN